MTHQVQHNLTRQQILEHPQSAFSIDPQTQTPECLEEIRVCGGVVFIFHVQGAGLGIKLSLEVRGAVD